uniref:Uncharacterized protein n=1 Tax=Anguilla anguilla TaxID=7936 RepID=A0A0E9U3E3_ANGAN
MKEILTGAEQAIVCSIIPS